jgi:4-amino-4-deoxy-L-arabinose transferase-like glycosyltransferase
MGRRSWIALLGILVLAAALRTYRLDGIPPGFYLDEASVGVEAHAILTSGRDQSGTLLPRIVPALQDWKHPLYIYATVPCEAVLGPTRLAVRLPAVIFGMLTVLLVALLALELSGEMRVGLLAAFVLAATPWHVHYSRTALSEGITLPFTFTLALWLYLRARRLGEQRRFALAGAAFGLVLYSYTPAKLLVPAFLAALALIERLDARAVLAIAKRLRDHAASLPAPPVRLPGAGETPVPQVAVSRRDAVFFGTALLLVAAPMLVAQVEHWDAIMTRFRSVSALHAEHPLEAVLRSYLAHLDPGFLFIRGDANLRHGCPGWGLLLLASAPFVALGLLRALARREVEDRLLLAWLVVYPLGAALTIEGIPHATRAILGLPLAAILAAMGVSVVLDRVLGARSRAATVLLAGALLLGNAGLVFKDYFFSYAGRPDVARSWCAGVERLIPELVAQRRVLRRVHFMPCPVRKGDGSHKPDPAEWRSVAIVREHVLFLTRFDPPANGAELEFTRAERQRGEGAVKSYFAWDEVVSWPRFLAKLPKDEALVTWGEEGWGRPPAFLVNDGEGNVAFQVYHGFGQ